MSYCGNNRLNRNLLNNTKTLGTRYKCLKIGIQKGRNLPIDQDYLDPYDPIDKTKIYCGKEDILTKNYDRMGNLGDCLRKGIGIGKRQKAIESNENNFDGSDEDFEFTFNTKHTIIFFIIEISLFLFLFFCKPKFLLKKKKNKKEEKEKEKEINPVKFFIFFTFLSILIFLLIFITLKTII